MGNPFPSPGDLPNPGIEPESSVLQADSLLSELPGKPSNETMLINLSYFSYKKIRFFFQVLHNTEIIPRRQ